jgi:hypothetical protein
MVDGSAELLPAEGAAEEFEVCGLTCLKVNGKNVEADGDVRRGKLAQVVVGHFAEHSLFVGVDGGLSRGDGACGPRFDLDEAEHVVFPCDQIEVSACAGCAPTACGDDEAPMTQIEVCGALTAASCGEVCGLAAATKRGAVEAIEEALKPVKTKLFETGH